MGYCVDMEINVVIPHENVAACLAAINELHVDEMLNMHAGGGVSGGDSDKLPVRQRRWYSWVKNPTDDGFKSLEDAIDAWRYSTEDEKDGLRISYFQGEKWGDDEMLYRAIAPYVKHGSFIRVHGEDGALWRYLFEDKGIKEQRGRVEYEDV